ncbi:hypothetical protein M231_03929 [Tremella mesenterica]|uniref:Uncharacterized protein n=1 Tax=Tremella mesenterica TaxID=5217 RepID=A0A4Q1BLS5_TREME|nr:hypothetical protein M231_03929 [Tremella mesenterica]
MAESTRQSMLETATNTGLPIRTAIPLPDVRSTMNGTGTAPPRTDPTRTSGRPNSSNTRPETFQPTQSRRTRDNPNSSRSTARQEQSELFDVPESRNTRTSTKTKKTTKKTKTNDIEGSTSRSTKTGKKKHTSHHGSKTSLHSILHPFFYPSPDGTIVGSIAPRHSGPVIMTKDGWVRK